VGDAVCEGVRVTVCGSRYVGDGALAYTLELELDSALRNAFAFRYLKLRYGALRWCVTTRYGVRYAAIRGMLRLCVTVVHYSALQWCVTGCVTVMRYGVRYAALRGILRCVTVVHYASALRWCVGDATSWVKVCE